MDRSAESRVLLLDGSQGPPYLPFTLNKGLTIVAAPGLSIFDWTGLSGPWNTSITVPAGQHVRIVGLHFAQANTPNGPAGHRVTVQGDVAFEQCSFGPSVFGTTQPCVDIQGGSVVLDHCTIHSGGVRLASGTCALTDCSVAGGNASFHGMHGYDIPSTPAISVSGGVLVASRITAVGGDAWWSGWNHFIPPSPALSLSTVGGLCFLSDSSLSGGDGSTPSLPGPGAPAIAGNANLTSIARTSLQGGIGAPAAPPFTGNVQNAPLVGIGIDHGFLLGQTTTVTSIPATGQLLAFAGGFPAPAITIAPVVEPVFVQASSLITLGVAVPVAGTPVNATIAVPNAQPLLGVGLFVHAFQLDAQGVRASPPAGGAIR